MAVRYRIAIHICDWIWENPLYEIFFSKIESNAWLIRSTIELTRVQVLGRLRASLSRYSILFAIMPHPQYLRNYDLKVLPYIVERVKYFTLSTIYESVWHFRILRVTWKSIKWPWAGPSKMNVKIKFRCPKQLPIVRRPRSLKGELTYSSSMNLAVSR